MARFSGEIDGESRKNRVDCLDLSETPAPVKTTSALYQMCKWFNMFTFDFSSSG